MSASDGTREALYGNDRQSMTIAIRRVDARIVGALIAYSSAPSASTPR